ncbi:hypothetical protein OG2516_15669 [Oceanicola granulosus HTCC2516]|uniref:Uncharacterized protein n=1 Tax=Oceanicola granulosus (strain ATCC BAA-861 / DSM 15982 / KCTC 12143 / HTCC2516) TaxID=314256 RepID=Q2CF79_OCEGH|nr:ArsC/Spx/MgsR family protein [Oceanicola granulosus]EAR51416.1 hypothetical protein OG2516_15669 [Oceanicola granulosus HTCC2516]
MHFYGLSTCDTCRKARRALDAGGRAYEVVDVRADGLAPEVLAEMLAALGPDLVNRRSTTWRQLPEAERQQPPEALLAAHPTLMKRPVILDDGRWWLGWGPEVQAAVLG